MDTTAAAEIAGVTVATVRHWARMGAVRAAKRAGRWLIDGASLARRIAMNPTPKEARVQLTAESVVAIGGRRWTKAGHDRVYINDWPAHLGLEVYRYKTGNVQSAYLGGKRISNSQASKLLACVEKVWFDAADGRLYVRAGGYTGREFADEAEIRAAIGRGVRAAVAAI